MSTVPTNPADCDRTTVYTGECRNFTDTEWIRFDSGRRRSPDASDGNTWLIDVAHGSFWMSDDKVRNLVPLVPAWQGGQWTRDDLPRIGSPNPAHDPVVEGALDTVVHWLNKHYPKPSGSVAVMLEDVHRAQLERDRLRRAHEIVEAERDQARESLRRLRDETDFDLFTVRDQLKQCRGEREQMTRDRDEWRERADQLRDERDDAVQSCITMGRARDEWKARAEALEAEAEQDVDPVEELTDNLADILYGHEMVTDQMRGVLERVVRAGIQFPEQEADHELSTS